MDDYISKHDFKRKLIDEKRFFPAIVARTLEELPVADVIPKEFLIRKEDEAYERGYAEGKTDAAREIFEQIRQKRNELWNKGDDSMFECWCKAEEEVEKSYTRKLTSDEKTALKELCKAINDTPDDVPNSVMEAMLKCVHLIRD